jgi:mRNA interferase MazF
VKKGDIILIAYPFTDLTGSKLHPALILYNTLHDFTACFITTQIDSIASTDILLKANKLNSLKKNSVIRTGKIANIDKKLAKGLLGNLIPSEIEELNIRLRELFSL